MVLKARQPIAIARGINEHVVSKLFTIYEYSVFLRNLRLVSYQCLTLRCTAANGSV